MVEAFWRFLTARFVRVANVRQPHRGALDRDRVRAMPIGDRYPGMAGLPVIVGDVVPVSERLQPGQLLLRRVAMFLKEHLSVWRHVREPYPDDSLCYPRPYRELTGTPWRPEAFQPGHDMLADLLVRGPFSFHARRRDDGDYELDMTRMEPLAVDPAYLPGGGRAVFSVQDGAATTRHLEGWGETHTPGSPGFAQAQARFVAGLGSYVTIVDHVLHTHLLTCGTIAVCTFEMLPAEHPLRTLLQPMVVETVRVNNYNVGALVGFAWSATPAYTRYPVETVHKLIDEETRRFRLATMDPVLDARTRGLLDLPGAVTVQSACELFGLIHDYTSAYCAHYLTPLDEVVRAWVARVDREMPGGVTDYLGLASLDDLTPEHVARLVAVHAYTASVRHYLVGELTRNYYLFPQWFPPAVPANGSSAPRGIMLEKANAIAVASVKRYFLVDETIPMPDEAGLQIRDHFFAQLRAFRDRQAAEDPDFHYRINPEALMSSIHA